MNNLPIFYAIYTRILVPKGVLYGQVPTKTGQRRGNNGADTNKLSEIETTAGVLWKMLTGQRQLFPQKWNSNAEISMQPLEQKTNLKIQELRNSLEKQKDQELTLLRQQTEKALMI